MSSKQSGTEVQTAMEGLINRLIALASQGRSIVAIAGAPGSGKSTLSDQLCKKLNARSSGLAAVVPMDGFHYDDIVLRSKGTQARKGAPFTFDVGGFRALLERLRTNSEAEVAVPLYDRELEISRAGARIIPQDVPIIIVEGNYLLLDQDPWNALLSLFDLKVSLAVPIEELERRLVNRWIEHGIDHDTAIKKARVNDLENARFVLAHSIAADIELSLG